MFLTATSFSAPAASAVHPRRPSLVSRALAAIALEIRVRRDLRQLSSLDDAALHDIGLARNEIENAVRCGRDDSGSSRCL